MEYCPRGTLTEYIAQAQQKLTVDEIRRFTVQVRNVLKKKFG
jgi:hypothetical protein